MLLIKLNNIGITMNKIIIAALLAATVSASNVFAAEAATTKAEETTKVEVKKVTPATATTPATSTTDTHAETTTEEEAKK